jgi:hypothetical protein
VAAGPDWEHACGAAELELIERDRVLAAWYGETRPVPLPEEDGDAGRGPLSPVAFQAYEFPSARDAGTPPVAGVFAFPATSAAPLAYGFGAGATIGAALRRAWSELHQRLGFLWGEEIPCQVPPPAPSVDFHQETYLCPASHDRLRAWLAGEHTRFGPCLARPAQPVGRTAGRRYVDLTPPGGLAGLHIVKALPDAEIPLVFGHGLRAWPSLGAPPVARGASGPSGRLRAPTRIPMRCELTRARASMAGSSTSRREQCAFKPRS